MYYNLLIDPRSQCSGLQCFPTQTSFKLTQHSASAIHLNPMLSACCRFQYRCRVSSNRTGKKIGKQDIGTPKNRTKIGFSSKKGTKVGFFFKKKFIFAYIYILNRSSSSEKGGKMDSSMTWTKSILMPSKARLKKFKECSHMK